MKTLVIVTLCLTLLLCSAVNAAEVAHWTLDEGSGAIANDSAGSNTGTIHNATWTTGVSGGALAFDAANQAYVDVPSSSSISFSQNNSFTISLWANTATNAFMLVSKMRNAGQSGVFGYELDYRGTGVQDFRFMTESSNNGATGVETGAFSTTPGAWYHVAAVYNNKDMKIYLNGVLKGHTTFTYDTGSTVPGGDLGLGARIVDGGPQAGWYYNGKMDDVRIYNEALSADAIMNLYQTTPEPGTMGLVAIGALMLRKRR